MIIEHLVLPMAGLGKRLRPLTDTCPKALVPINGKPLVWYVLEETRGTSIRTVTAVVSRQHTDQFKHYFESIQDEFPYVTFYIRAQDQPFGDGHAVLQALDVITTNPCAVRFTDDVLIHTTSLLASLIDAALREDASTLLVQRVPKEDVSRYGIVTVSDARSFNGGKLYQMLGIVEKPPVHDALSDLAVIGGYILMPTIITTLAAMFAGISDPKHDALRIADGFACALGANEKAFAWEFPGTRLDCGTLESFYASEEFLKNLVNRQ